MQQSFPRTEIMRAHNTGNAIQINQRRSGKLTNQSPKPTTKPKNKLINRKESCSRQLKAAHESQPPGGNDEELQHATIHKSNIASFVAQLLFGSDTPLIVQENHFNLKNDQSEDQHHTSCVNNRTPNANGQSSALPFPNQMNELKKALERERKPMRFFTLQVIYDERNVQGLKNQLVQTERVPSQHIKT